MSWHVEQWREVKTVTAAESFPMWSGNNTNISIYDKGSVIQLFRFQFGITLTASSKQLVTGRTSCKLFKKNVADRALGACPHQFLNFVWALSKLTTQESIWQILLKYFLIPQHHSVRNTRICCYAVQIRKLGPLQRVGRVELPLEQ